MIRSLEKRGVLLIGTTKKLSDQEGGFVKFFRSLVKASLPLMKNVLTSLAKNVWLPNCLLTVLIHQWIDKTTISIQHVWQFQ